MAYDSVFYIDSTLVNNGLPDMLMSQALQIHYRMPKKTIVDMIKLMNLTWKYFTRVPS